MKWTSLTIASLALLAFSDRARADTDREVEAHKVVLDLAGAFSNEGFKMRDGHWIGALKQRRTHWLR